MADDKHTAFGVSVTSLRASANASDLELARILEVFPDLLLVHDCFGQCLAARVPAGFPLPPAETLIGRQVLSFFPWHCSEEDLALYRWVDETKEPQVLERVLPSKPTHRFFEIRILPLEPGKLLSIAREVTARRLREDDLRGALLHKDTLLKELHHRVKNNLQVMTSLLALQASATKDSTARELAKESERRVRSMAIVHNYLDSRREDGRINLVSYLTAVVDELFHAFGASVRVARVIEADSIELRWELATNLGLIVNELVSNVLKYAFPNRQPGNLQIRIKSPGRGLELSIADDGCGLPPGMDVTASKTIGLQLVTTLVEQLEGSMQIVSPPGTAVRIRFPTWAVTAEGGS